ncbi:MAG TPA: DoxX family protein [Polyangia bacterium]
MSVANAALILRRRLLGIVDRLGFLAPLLIRVTLGLVFLRSGWGKLVNLDDTSEFFSSLGIPLPRANAIVAASVECFGGAAFLLGLGTRLVALPLAFVMAIAIGTAQWGDVDGVHAFLGLEEWSYLVMFLVVAIIGPGPVSIDHLIARRLEAKAADDRTAAPPVLTAVKQPAEVGR